MKPVIKKPSSYWSDDLISQLQSIQLKQLLPDVSRNKLARERTRDMMSLPNMLTAFSPVMPDFSNRGEGRGEMGYV